jgi:sugar porter (SP) family MFS transporter
MPLRHEPDDHAAPRGNLRQSPQVVAVAAVAALAGLLFGYDTGVISGAILFIKEDFDLGATGQGIVVSAILLGAIVGAAVSGPISDRFGRRLTVIAAAVIFAAGALGSAAAPDEAVLIIARVVVGVAVGVASAVAPIYISEVAPMSVRGSLVSLFQLAVTVGIVVSYLVDLAFAPSESWRWMLGLAVVPAVLLGTGMYLLPRSPRWLMAKGREDEARQVLVRLRTAPGDDVDEELREIRATVGGEAVAWRDLLSPLVKPALTVGVTLAVLQQVTGINTVLYYAPTILEFAGFDSKTNAILATVGIGLVFVCFTLVAIALVDRAGRRILLLTGIAGMVAALGVLGLAFEIDASEGTVGAISLVSLMAYVAAFAISLGPIFWLLNAELYPLRVRGRAGGVGALANWTANFAVSLTFLPLIDAIGKSATFWLYGAVGVLAFIFCLTSVPETKGRRLEELEDHWRARAQRRGARARPAGGP